MRESFMSGDGFRDGGRGSLLLQEGGVRVLQLELLSTIALAVAVQLLLLGVLLQLGQVLEARGRAVQGAFVLFGALAGERLVLDHTPEIGVQRVQYTLGVLLRAAVGRLAL